MKNIYEIIAEQKMMVDINIASYDLQYASTYLVESSEEYYIEEGLGETVKNIANNVVEFIKTIIRKIQEMVKKVIDWLFGKKDTEAKLNKEIKDINEGKTTEETSVNDKEEDEEDWKNLSREEILRKRRIRKLKEKNEKNNGKPITISAYTPQEKKAMKQAAINKEKNNRKEIKNAYKKLDNIEEVLKACKGKVEMKTFYKLSDLETLGSKFFNEVPKAIENVKNGKEFKGILLSNVFKRLEHADGNNISDYIAAELIISQGNEHSGYINIFADKVLDYIRGGKKLKNSLLAREKVAVDKLNKLMRMAQYSNNNEVLNGAKKLAAMIGQFTQVLLRELVESQKTADAIAVKAKNMYKEQIIGMRK